MTWALVAYVLLVLPSGDVIISRNHPNVVQSGLTETDCSIAIEVVTDEFGDQFYFECQPET